ncbi:MAG: ABC transporter permease [Actinomycetota bacterium]|nr:ABC transporter permease [Actinomycetota bacterium]
MSLTEAEGAALALEGPLDEAGGRRRQLWLRLRHSPAAVVGAVLIGLFVVVAVAAPLLAPHDPAPGDLSDIRPGFIPGPSAEHPLGLDGQGRDELSRLIYGARSSLVIGVVSVALGGLVGVAVGAVAAGFGGWVDTVIMRVMDVMLAIPGLLFAVAIAALLGPSLASVMVAIGVAGVPVVARLLRGVMLSERERDYVVAARAIGLRRRTIILRHVLPNSVSPVLVAATLALGGAILDAAALAFLGLGPSDPAIPEWGTMLAEGQSVLQTSPQLVLLPGLAIVLTVLGFNLLGDALREALDPKLRR